MPLRLDTPVQFLKGVGPRRSEAFARMGIHVAEDLLYHIPHRYLDATSVTPIVKADVGKDVAVVGRVVSKGVLPTRRRLRIFRAVLRDETGLIECAWPGQAFLDRSIKEGQLLLASGPVKYYHGRQLSPREHVVLAERDEEGEETQRGLVIPVYSATEGLTHRQIRRLVADHLDALLPLVEDVTPPSLLAMNGLPPLGPAIEHLHRPQSLDEAEQGRRRLAFDELLDLQLVVARARHLAKKPTKGGAHVLKKELTSELKENLPFSLTADQKRAIREITADMTSPERMHRLLMGDVGSGKTVVALFAMLLAVENNGQAVFMAPTEILAEQHVQTMAMLLRSLNIVPEVLLGRMTASEKQAARRRIADGASRLIVGTHALVQDNTEFRRLGLVVIDEQHRFGVEQRAKLIEKGLEPDVLLLTATPIPRTMALTMYGDLDMSVLREKPVGRGEVKTTVRTNRQRGKVYDFLQKECERGGQAYVVYPVIDESEKVDLKAATTMAEELRAAVDPVTVGLVHGRMKSDQRDAVMRSFRDGKISILVATTVIEVGIDVENATVMVIEHPERFGLAQLHQLRGRVGRGSKQSYCILIAVGKAGADRLQKFTTTKDGFEIAELDLQERGMGQLAGTKQSGGVPLRFTDLTTDGDLIEAARRPALDLIREDPDMAKPKHDALRRRLERRYERGMELFRVG